MQAVILSGGLGSRLSTSTAGLPKALVDVAGRPLLHWQLDLLARHRIADVLLLVSYGADRIRSACGDGSAWGITIRYIEEKEPQGTAGAVLQAYRHLEEAFAVLYGDTVLNVDLSRFWAAHRATRADATLFVHPNDHPHDSDIVEADPTGRILAFHPCPHPAGRDLPNCVNAALYVVGRHSLTDVAPSTIPFDFGKHLFPMLLEQGTVLHAYRSREYIKDAGTPERLARVDADVRSGRVGNGSLECRVPAIFFDRDGTLVDDPGHIARPDQLALLPDAAAAVHRVNRAGHAAVLVTNQPVVARGEVDEPGLRLIHNRLERLLGRNHAYLDGIYYCPHHPDRGFPGERPEYKMACDCRKPAIGMLTRATEEMNIDLAQSWLIGDSDTDIETAARAGVLSARVGTGKAGNDRRYARRPDFAFPTVGGAVDFILDRWPRLQRRADAVAGQVPPRGVVLIGGLAGTGKSSFASALAWMLRHRRGIAAKVIALDGWIMPPEHRAAIDGPGATLRIPLCMTGRSETSYELRVDPSDVVILEGVEGLSLPVGGSRPVLRIHVAREDGASLTAEDDARTATRDSADVVIETI